ncbi:hypothetical protein ACWCP6_22260 [Streptomyces sp. NPDC002004]
MADDFVAEVAAEAVLVRHFSVVPMAGPPTRIVPSSYGKNPTGFARGWPSGATVAMRPSRCVPRWARARALKPVKSWVVKSFMP